jgi:outer membrane immunogenic protein
LPPPPVFSWTGWYVGINGGYGWSNSTGDSFCITPGGALNGVGCDSPNTGVVRPRGGFVGGQAGYNRQTNAIVYGIETDIHWSDIKSSNSVTDLCCNPGAVPTGIFNATSKLDWFGTFRGRLGVLATPKALLYVTGGLIYGHESTSALLTYTPTNFYPNSASTTRAGGTVGAGLEYAFTPNLSGKVEGLWYDMGSLTSSFICPAGATTCTAGYTIGSTFKFSGEMVRGGLNWKFNGFSR